MSTRRVHRLRVGAGTSILGLITIFAVAAPRPVAAMTFTCVDSSRYQYVYKLFGDDLRAFATYFDIDPKLAPPPDACRAALASDGVARGDADKLIDLIAKNHGWLDTLYLDSHGGDVDGGLRTALVTRGFWLKTRLAPSGASLVYDPDFGPIAPNLQRLAFDKLVASVPTRYGTEHRTICASACTYTLAAGMDRQGIANVHRPVNHTDSIEARAVNGEKAEARMMGIYKKLDTGDAFMALTRQTARQTTSPAVVARFPRFVEDALLDDCKSDAAQLDDLAALLRFSLAQNGSGLVSLPNDSLQGALTKLEARRQDVTKCVAARYERERLAAFNRNCSKGCSADSMKAPLDKQITDLAK